MTFFFSADEEFARQLDAEDPLRHFREKFHLPLGKDGKPLIYFAGNSLGLMPKAARKIVEQELDNWAELAVDAHHRAGTPWYSYHETLREPTARLIGAQPTEVICMNSLTVNLHLMLATFYRPTKSRNKILMEEPAFPSDTYAIKSQIIHHGFDPKDVLILARPRKGGDRLLHAPGPQQRLAVCDLQFQPGAARCPRRGKYRPHRATPSCRQNGKPAPAFRSWWSSRYRSRQPRG